MTAFRNVVAIMISHVLIGTNPLLFMVMVNKLGHSIMLKTVLMLFGKL